jgi:hypothetical protein
MAKCKLVKNFFSSKMGKSGLLFECIILLLFMNLLSDNSLTIDYCRYSTDGKVFSEPVYVLDIGELLKNDETIKYIRYTFKSTFNYSDSAFIAVELPELFEIKVNGKPVVNQNLEFFIDKSFKKIDISGLIQKGENYIDLKIIKNEEIQIESIYVGGNFGVNYASNNTFELAPLKSRINATDLTREGLTFFAGSVMLSKQIELNEINSSEKYFIKLGDLAATVAEVTVNGQFAGALCWKPYDLDVTPFLKNGKNSIQVPLTNSLHNMLGYHHSSNRSKFQWINARSFNDKNNWTNDYFILPLGISHVAIEKSKSE